MSATTRPAMSAPQVTMRFLSPNPNPTENKGLFLRVPGPFWSFLDLFGRFLTFRAQQKPRFSSNSLKNQCNFSEPVQSAVWNIRMNISASMVRGLCDQRGQAGTCGSNKREEPLTENAKVLHLQPRQASGSSTFYGRAIDQEYQGHDTGKKRAQQAGHGLTKVISGPSTTYRRAMNRSRTGHEPRTAGSSSPPSRKHRKPRAPSASPRFAFRLKLTSGSII